MNKSRKEKENGPTTVVLLEYFYCGQGNMGKKHRKRKFYNLIFSKANLVKRENWKSLKTCKIMPAA